MRAGRAGDGARLRRCRRHAGPAGPEGLPARAPRQPAGRDDRRSAPLRRGLVATRTAPRGRAARGRERQPGRSCCRTTGSGRCGSGTTPSSSASIAKARNVVLRSGEKQRLELPLAVLEYTWKPSGYWSMVALPPDRIAATASEADWAAAVAAMERVAGHGRVAQRLSHAARALAGQPDRRDRPRQRRLCGARPRRGRTVLRGALSRAPRLASRPQQPRAGAVGPRTAMPKRCS